MSTKMKVTHIIILYMLLLCTAGVKAQSKLWISGTAVPGGTQQLERFTTNTAGYNFKFHGTLLPGTFYVQTTEELKSSTRLYAPTQEDANVVNDGIKYEQVRLRDSLSAQWVVLFEADNYRFTVTPSKTTLQGELFTWWYEAIIVGGCVAENQTDDWYLNLSQPMTQSATDPYEWTWTGLLKNYDGNVESNRLKIVGQYDWGPKSLHPFKADTPLLNATQVWYNATSDYKWTISEDGYYRITCNVFRETISAEYLGTEPPTDGVEEVEVDAEIRVQGRQISVISPNVLEAGLYTLDGKQIDTVTGQVFRLQAPSPGIYVLRATDGSAALTRKLIIR